MSKIFSLTEFNSFMKSTRGVSNTPLVQVKKKNFCIDYLSVVIDKKFIFDTIFANEVMKALSIDKNVAVRKCGLNGYDVGYLFNEYIAIYTGGEFTKKDGKETTQIELKGEGCRKFEELGGSWIELFEFLIKNEFDFKRIDLAYDDFEGTLNYDTLLEKVVNHEFVSCSKKLPVILFSKFGNEYKGFSITFGSRNSSRSLQIYDKKSERMNKNFAYIDCKTWTRCEIRFRNDYANEIKESVLVSLYENKFDLLVKSLIRNVVDFKEYYDSDNTARLKTWKVWDKFLDESVRIKIVRQYDLEKSLCKKANWMKRSVAKTLMDLYLSNPDYFYSLINFLIISKIEKLDNKDLCVVNNGSDIFHSNNRFRNKEELVEFIKDNLMVESFNIEYLRSLLGNDVNETIMNLEKIIKGEDYLYDE